ncbi:MAG: Zn-ribbon domain-containing OB-fold protein [Gammaproteobacteria bacterium]
MSDALAPEFAAFNRWLAAGELRLPYCDACRRHHWYPMPRCPHCRAAVTTWRAVGGRARLYSWTEVSHRFDPRYQGPLPYVVALVEFDDAPGVRLVSNLVDTPRERLVVDLPLVADFRAACETPPRVLFRAALTRSE